MKSARLVSEITSRKMRALDREREVLKHNYDVTLQVANSDEYSLSEKLENLYENITHMGHYHPDIQNLEPVIALSKIKGCVSDSLLEVWIDKLTTEAKTGQYKQLQGFIYGSILDEYIKSKKDESLINENISSTLNSHNSENSNKSEVNNNSKTTDLKKLGKDADVFKTILTPSDPNQYNLIFLETFFELHPPTALRKKIVRTCENNKEQEVTQNEINQAAETLLTRSTLKNDLRESLIQLQSNKIILNEYATEISLMLNNIEDWNWLETEDSDSEKKYHPSLFVKLHKNGKKRSYIDCNPINAIFIEVIGKRWSSTIRSELHDYYKSVYNFTHFNRNNEDKDKRIPYPKAGIEKALGNHFSLIAPPKQSTRKRPIEKTEYDGDNVDDVDENAMQHSLEEEIDNEIIASRNLILNYISTQIKLVKSVLPNHEISIAQADIENCYPSIQHPVLFEVLKHYGFSEKWLNFFKRYLEPTVTLPDGSLAKIESGVFLKQQLSLLFVELLMCVVDISVKSSDNSTNGPHPMDLTYVRAVDDIYMWSLSRDTTQVAWNTLDFTVKQLGLKLNLEKSSSALLSNTGADQTPPVVNDTPNHIASSIIPYVELPKNDITFGFLILNKSTWCWNVNEEKMALVVAKMTQRVNECTSIIGKANIYNSYIKYIEHHLNKCSIALGTNHLDLCIETFKNITKNFIEKGQTVIGYFDKEIRKRFTVELESIPEVWFHWPMTAGGLGILHPVLKYTVMRNSMVDRGFDINNKPIDPLKKMPNDEYFDSLLWMCNANDNWYYSFTSIMSSDFDLPSPTTTNHLNEVISKFTSRFDYDNNYYNRGSSLSPYWKWIISTYDAQMVALFGDYSFTSSQVVPISLIMEIKSSSK